LRTSFLHCITFILPANAFLTDFYRFLILARFLLYRSVYTAVYPDEDIRDLATTDIDWDVWETNKRP